MSPRRKNTRKTVPGSVFRRGAKWAFKFYGPPHPLTGDREPITKSGFATEDDAWEGMAQARAALATETYVRPSRATVADFFEQWFPSVRTSCEPTTAENYETLARAYVLPIIGKRPMQEITPSVISALYDHLLTKGRRKQDTNWQMYQRWKAAQAAKEAITPRQLADVGGVTYAGARRALRRYEAGRIPSEPTTGLAPKTVLSVHIMLGPAMATAALWKFISVNPMIGVKPPTVSRQPRTTWTPQEMTKFLDAARGDRFYALWVLVATTGMRRSELCGLRRPALDLDAAVVRMHATRVIAGKAVRNGGGKSRRSRRPIALDEFTVAVLREHVNRLDREERGHGSGYHDDGLIFCWDDGRPIYPDTISERFNRLVERANVPFITLHGVRHSYATIALRSGVHPKIVSSRLGHATVAFTLDTYSEDIPDLDREAAASISGLFLPPSPLGREDVPGTV